MSSRRLVLSFAALFCGAATAASVVDDDGATCNSKLSKDQVLLQFQHLGLSQGGACGTISRRRRHGPMKACRRRHSSPGHADSDGPGDRWTCDEAANVMRCAAVAPKDFDKNMTKMPASSSTEKVSETAACGQDVSRRRRQASMSCRRRHSSPGHGDSDKPGDLWTCDEDAHVMKCNKEAEAPPTTPVPSEEGAPTPAPIPSKEEAQTATPIPSEEAGEADHEGDSEQTHRERGVLPHLRKLLGFPKSGSRKARGLWCEVDIPPVDWSLTSCPSSGSTTVRVLTYNLFWWNLFDRHDGSDRSAGRLMKRTADSDGAYDMMAFQEVGDINRVLSDAEMSEAYTALDGGSGISIAYRHDIWTVLSQGTEYVGEDSKDQYYGKRRVMWARMQNVAGKVVFFMNHHGPLRVSQGGGCTGSATSLNIMRVIGEHAESEDVVILVGDFNARPWSSRIREMKKRIGHVFSGRAMGGVDHVFSNCAAQSEGQILGKGDGRHKSDHDAISATFTV